MKYPNNGKRANVSCNLNTIMKILLIKKIVIVAIVIGCLLSLTQMEYDTIKFSRFVYPLIWISFPFILKYLSLNSSFRITHILIASVVYIVILCFSFLFGVFCAWSSDGILYKNKKDKSILIVCRRYDCYGTAEDCRLYKVKKLTEHLKWVKKFQEEKVDKIKWDFVSYGTSP